MAIMTKAEMEEVRVRQEVYQKARQDYVRAATRGKVKHITEKLEGCDGL